MKLFKKNEKVEEYVKKFKELWGNDFYKSLIKLGLYAIFLIFAVYYVCFYCFSCERIISTSSFAGSGRECSFFLTRIISLLGSSSLSSIFKAFSWTNCLLIFFRFYTVFPTNIAIFAATHRLLACGMAKMGDGGKPWKECDFLRKSSTFPQKFSTHNRQ